MQGRRRQIAGQLHVYEKCFEGHILEGEGGERQGSGSVVEAACLARPSPEFIYSRAFTSSHQASPRAAPAWLTGLCPSPHNPGLCFSVDEEDAWVPVSHKNGKPSEG